MNKFTKVGLGLAAMAAVAFASGCAEHAPAFTCGKVDYKSYASCKAATCKGMKHHRMMMQQQQQQAQ